MQIRFMMFLKGDREVVREAVNIASPARQRACEVLERDREVPPQRGAEAPHRGAQRPPRRGAEAPTEGPGGPHGGCEVVLRASEERRRVTEFIIVAV